MASLRTSLILAVIAGALLAFILWFERGTPSSGELERRKGNALPGFVRDHVTKLEIQYAGKLTVLARASRDDESEHAWQVEAPYRAQADRELVEGLLADLEFLDARRRLEHISSADRARFGFDHPRFRIWFTIGRTRTRIAVGNASPRGDGVYVEGVEPGTAFVVDNKLAQTLAQEPGAYHSKELISDLHADQVEALRIRDPHGERALRREGEAWSLSEPQLGLASGSAATELISALDALRAKHFVVQRASAAEAASYGLDQPRLELALTLKPASAAAASPAAAGASAAKAEAASERAIRVQVGKPCPQYPGESYARAGADGPVMCLLDGDLAKLQPELSALRETRLLPFESEEPLGSLQLTAGNTRLLLNKSDSGWAYELTRDGQTELKGAARAEAVSEWLDALRATKAQRWEHLDSKSAGPSALELRIERKAKPPYVLRLDPTSGEPRGRRGSEPEQGVFPAAALELLAPSAARFRTLELARIAEPSLRELEIRRGDQLERLSRTGQSAPFAIVAPAAATPDAVRLAELTRLLGALEAVRFVADAPAQAHGLTTPVSQLSADYEATGKDAPRQRFRLRVGAATDGGHFAQLEGQPGVFVLPAQFADLLAEPLVSRTTLAASLEQLHSISIERAGRSLRIERRGQEFVADGTSLEPRSARDRVEALATLRATRATHYGPPLPDEGFGKPYARIAVTNHGGDAYTLLLGAETAGGRHARRSDVQIGFVVPASSVSALLGEPGQR